MDTIDPKTLLRLRTMADEARRLNYSPYSGLLVLAAAETCSGAVAGGSNVENSNYSLTMHAEEVAILAAFERAGENPAPGRLRHVYVAGVGPCGSCRQFVQEFGATYGLWIVECLDQKRLRAGPLADLPLPGDITVVSFAETLPRPWINRKHGG
jgi:cytidine deaminase